MVLLCGSPGSTMTYSFFNQVSEVDRVITRTRWLKFHFTLNRES